MKAGMVVSLRVSPKDCQSVLDVMNLIGMNTKAHSFSYLVSLALSSLLESQRLAGNIPQPDSFEYLNRMQCFKGKASNGTKAALTSSLNSAGPKIQAPAMPIQEVKTSAYIPPEMTPEQRAAGIRLGELAHKKDIAESNSAVIWSSSDENEYQRLYKVVYGG